MKRFNSFKSNSVTPSALNLLKNKPNHVKKYNMILNKDFQQANAKISERIISPSNLSKPEPSYSMKPREEIVFNPKISIPVNTNKKEEQIISGSNYGNINPEIGVVIRENHQSKNGGWNFNNQFGKMSLKEYEQIRNRYLKDNPNNVAKANNKETTESIHYNRISGEYDNKDSNINDSEKNANNNNISSSKVNDGVMYNSKISNFDWSNNENNNYYNYNNYNPKQSNERKWRTEVGSWIINNENWFKNRKNVDIRSDNKYNNSNMSFINDFNNQIMSNAKWGSANTQNNVSLSNTLPLKYRSENNLRTRKKN